MLCLETKKTGQVQLEGSLKVNIASSNVVVVWPCAVLHTLPFPFPLACRGCGEGNVALPEDKHCCGGRHIPLLPWGKCVFCTQHLGCSLILVTVCPSSSVAFSGLCTSFATRYNSGVVESCITRKETIGPCVHPEGF